MADLNGNDFPLDFDIKAAMESLKAYRYAEGQIFNTTGIKDLYQQEEPISAIAIRNRQRREEQMSCYRSEREMKELRRCGCNQCRERYYNMERDYYKRNGDARYYKGAQIPYASPMYLAGEFITKETKVEKIEEPKNYAVKLLVDQLKAQQVNLDSKKVAIDQDKAMVKMYQTQLKNKNTEKLGFENKIKELSVALKKLGHTIKE